uniref:Uncharacterized protein n=1 Tax=Arundo donax TaxID=35708 RepID=A0A0A9HPZ0_ARUDO
MENAIKMDICLHQFSQFLCKKIRIELLASYHMKNSATFLLFQWSICQMHNATSPMHARSLKKISPSYFVTLFAQCRASIGCEMCTLHE